MKVVHYSAGSVLIGDDAADALLDYAAALARRSLAATVELTTIASGLTGTTKFLVGPASELVAVPTEAFEDEPDNAAVVAEMRRRIADLDGRPDARAL